MKIGCICYLVSAAPNDVLELIHSLALLHRNYLKAHPCDVFLYHEAGLYTYVRDYIQKAIGFPVIFIKIKFPNLPPSVKVSHPNFGIGYRHMCHFFANDIFNRPELQEYEYYMRLDTDSEILSPVRCNIFEHMREHEYIYGFVCNDRLDSPVFSKGLWPLADAFVASHAYKAYKQLYADIPERGYFYTNLEVCKLGWFRQKPWADFFDAVHQSQGIYTTRWGDHIIRYIGVNLYAPPDKVVKLPIHYYHQDEFGKEYADKQSASAHLPEGRSLRQSLERALMRTPLYFPLRICAGWLLSKKHRLALAMKKIYVWVPFYFDFRNWNARRKQEWALGEWVKKGKPSPPPHVVKEQAIRSYAKMFGLKTLVETGTYYGDMVQAMRLDFDRIYSIELSAYLYRTAARRFAGAAGITLINGDSGTELGNLVGKIDEPALFWLDGHYSEGDTAQGSKDTPVYEELAHIFSSKHSGDVILIDDARCFGTYPSYPTLDELFSFIRSKRPDANIEVENDFIRITPNMPT
jgi:hypothetical protein